MIFVDTGFFFALAAEDYPDHDRVREVFEEFPPKRLPHLWLTTNHVVFETITLTYLVKRQDKGYTAVDCLSVVIMEVRGIKEALTLDGDLKHRFTARPGPRS